MLPTNTKKYFHMITDLVRVLHCYRPSFYGSVFVEGDVAQNLSRVKRLLIGERKKHPNTAFCLLILW